MLTTQSLSVQPGPDAFTVVPDSTLAVARTAYKNNSSKYTINGCASNYKEVQTLLKGRGIDLDHNRFLILQVCSVRPALVSSHFSVGRGRIYCANEAKGTVRT
jgi:hypothetical protein